MGSGADGLEPVGERLSLCLRRFIYLRDTGLVAAGRRAISPVFAYTQGYATFGVRRRLQPTSRFTAGGIDWKIDGSADRARGTGRWRRPAADPALTVNAGVEGRRGIFMGRLSAEYGAEQDKVARVRDGDAILHHHRCALVGIDLAENLKLLVEGRNLTDEEVRLHASPLKDRAPLAGAARAWRCAGSSVRSRYAGASGSWCFGARGSWRWVARLAGCEAQLRRGWSL